NALRKRISVNSAWWDSKMLPHTGQVRKSQIDHLHVVVFVGFQDVIGFGAIQEHSPLPRLAAIWQIFSGRELRTDGFWHVSKRRIAGPGSGGLQKGPGQTERNR